MCCDKTRIDAREYGVRSISGTHFRIIQQARRQRNGWECIGVTKDCIEKFLYLFIDMWECAALFEQVVSEFPPYC